MATHKNRRGVDNERDWTQHPNLWHERDVFIFRYAVDNLSVEKYVNSRGRGDLGRVTWISHVRHLDCYGAALFGYPLWLLRLVLCCVIDKHDTLVNDVLHAIMATAGHTTDGEHDE